MFAGKRCLASRQARCSRAADAVAGGCLGGLGVQYGLFRPPERPVWPCRMGRFAEPKGCWRGAASAVDACRTARLAVARSRIGRWIPPPAGVCAAVTGCWLFTPENAVYAAEACPGALYAILTRLGVNIIRPGCPLAGLGPLCRNDSGGRQMFRLGAPILCR